MTGIFVSSVELGVLLAESYLINNMENGEMGYRDWRWMVVANDPIQWWDLV